jgi:hypothetical protein
MADVVERNNNGLLYFIVGALIVAVAVIAWLAFANDGGVAEDTDITLDVPAVEAPDVDAPDLPAPGGELDADVNVNPPANANPPAPPAQ